MTIPTRAPWLRGFIAFAALLSVFALGPGGPVEIGATPTMFWGSGVALAADAPSARHIQLILVLTKTGEVDASKVARRLAKHLGDEAFTASLPPGGLVTLHGAAGRKRVAHWRRSLGHIGVQLSVSHRYLTLNLNTKKLLESKSYSHRVLRSISAEGDRGALPITRRERVARPQKAALPRFTHGLNRVAGPHQGGPPVVLIHGLDASASGLYATGVALSKLGYDAYIFQYSSGRTLPEIATTFGIALRQLYTDRGTRVSVVSTSMGALVTQLYLEHDPAYAGEIERFIALCPPFHGSELARFQANDALVSFMGLAIAEGMGGVLVFQRAGRSGDALIPGSTLLTKLAQGRRNPKTRYSIIAGDQPLVPLEGIDAIIALGEILAREAGSTTVDGIVAWAREVAAAARPLAAGQGDGAVSLKSATLEGVTDRVVLPLHHLSFLDAAPDHGPDIPIPALDAVTQRLPTP